jgi:hypothetical protein
MKSLDVGQTNLDDCVTAAQSEPIILKHRGEPVALVVSVEGLDDEQLELGMSPDFWAFIKARRAQSTISRQELDRRMDSVES